MLGGEENTCAGDVYGLAIARFLACTLVQKLIADIPFDREAIGVAPIGLLVLLSTGSHFFRFLTLGFAFRSDKVSFSGKGNCNNRVRGLFAVSTRVLKS
jgi:hypothetical protein